MKITVLTENTSKYKDIEAEHGLSLYIEADGKKILFDMGQSDLFLRNAKKLGISISDVDMAIISHGHYDHGGGLRAFLETNKKAPVYINRHAFLPHYNGIEKYIGLDVTLKDSERLIYTDDEFNISDSLSLHTYNEKEFKHSFGCGELTEKQGEKFVPDDFNHEQYLLIKESKKSILISGCSHKGIIDIVDISHPDVLVGGFHFSKIPLDAKLKDAAILLDSYKTTYFTCHCTGEAQYEFMKNYIKELHYISAGDTFSI